MFHLLRLLPVALWACVAEASPAAYLPNFPDQQQQVGAAPPAHTGQSLLLQQPSEVTAAEIALAEDETVDIPCGGEDEGTLLECLLLGQDKRGFGDRKRGFGDKRNYGDAKRGFGDRKRGFGDKRAPGRRGPQSVRDQSVPQSLLSETPSLVLSPLWFHFPWSNGYMSGRGSDYRRTRVRRGGSVAPLVDSQRGL